MKKREAKKATSRRLTRRRGKRKLKKWVKVAIMLFIVLLAISGLLYAMYLNANKPPVAIGDIDIEDEAPVEDEAIEGAIVDIEDMDDMSYTVLSAGDGESIFIKNGETEALIDVGPTAASNHIIGQLKSKVDGKLDYVILTNGDSGRIGGFKNISSNFTIDTVILGDLGESDSLIRSLIPDDVTVVDGKDMVMEVGDGCAISIFMPESASDDINDRSLVTYTTYGKVSFLATSHVGTRGEEKLIGKVKTTNVYVASRYGQRSDVLLDNLSTYYVVASTKSPDSSLLQKQSRIYTTGDCGDLVFTSDGETVVPQFSQEAYYKIPVQTE